MSASDQQPWSEQEMADAIRWRREGRGSTWIARQLKRTRNSVIGKLWREGVESPFLNQHGEGTRGQPRHRPLRRVCAIPMRFKDQARD